MPREEFYRNFAGLYRQTDLGPYFEMVRSGKLTVEDMKRGKELLDSMSRAETYAVNDPILGRRNGGYAPTVGRGAERTGPC